MGKYPPPSFQKAPFFTGYSKTKSRDILTLRNWFTKASLTLFASGKGGGQFNHGPCFINKLLSFQTFNKIWLRVFWRKILKIAWVILPRQPFFQNAYKTLKRSSIKRANLEHIKSSKIVLFYLFAAHCVSKFRILRYFPWVLLKNFQYQENFKKKCFFDNLALKNCWDHQK